MPEIGLVIVDPGHFHVALVQQEMHPNVSPRVHVYAPLGPTHLAIEDIAIMRALPNMTVVSVCDADESCVGGSCVCGSTAPGSGAACDDAGQTPVCTGSGCACDADSVCGAGEACVGGACYCGA